MEALKRGPPRLDQPLPGLQECVALGKHEKSSTRKQVRMKLPHQFTKDSFGPIASDRIPKSLPHDNSHAAWGIVHLIRQEIEERGRNSSTMMFDDLNLPAAAQKHDISTLRFRYHWKGECFFAASHSFMVPEKTPAGR